MDLTSRMLMMGAGGAATIQVTLFSATTSAASTIALPASLAAGDICVLLDRANALTSPFVSGGIPSGYTSINAVNGAGSVNGAACSYRVLTGSGDLSGTLTGLNGADSVRKYLLVFRPDPTATSVAVNSVASSGMTTSAPTAQTITGASSPAPVISVAFVSARGEVPSPSFSTMTLVGSGNATGVAGYQIFNTAPSDLTVSAADVSTSNCLQSFYLALS